MSCILKLSSREQIARLVRIEKTIDYKRQDLLDLAAEACVIPKVSDYSQLTFEDACCLIRLVEGIEHEYIHDLITVKTWGGALCR